MTYIELENKKVELKNKAKKEVRQGNFSNLSKINQEIDMIEKKQFCIIQNYKGDWEEIRNERN